MSSDERERFRIHREIERQLRNDKNKSYKELKLLLLGECQESLAFNFLLTVAYIHKQHIGLYLLKTMCALEPLKYEPPNPYSLYLDCRWIDPE